MHGLKQIEVVTQGDGWHLVGLDDQGRVWFGTTRRTTKGQPGANRLSHQRTQASRAFMLGCASK
jgi:hypothetical protein